MAKKEKVPPDAQSLRKAVARFTKQLDRGTALVAAAWLDDALEACLRAAFRPEKGTADAVCDSSYRWSAKYRRTYC